MKTIVLIVFEPERGRYEKLQNEQSEESIGGWEPLI